MFSLDTFKRVTSGKPILEEVDGLRFLAISYVIIAHIYHFFYAKTPFFKSEIDDSKILTIVNKIAQDGQHGVAIFFVISGFILALPFARQYLKKSKAVVLKQYYLRRLTRLEPPYIIVLLLLFAGILIKNLYSFQELFPHLLASLTYTHNIFFDSMSWITPVAWSLEVEVQFYLLAPFLAFVFKIKKCSFRLLILIFLILLAACLQETNLFQNSFALSMSLLGWFQYFFVGFILADIYVSQKLKIKTSKLVEIFFGILLLFGLSFLSYKGSIISRIAYPVFCFAFFTMVLQFPFWKKVFSTKFISVVGGMCYSIYLLHFAIISLIGNYSLKFKISNSFFMNYVVHVVIFLMAVLISSGIFFLLVEKPCMKKDWPLKLARGIRNNFLVSAK
jgi:peptidoglycan/LPS O-acetylase OafA/YrhL